MFEVFVYKCILWRLEGRGYFCKNPPLLVFKDGASFALIWIGAFDALEARSPVVVKPVKIYIAQ